MFAERVLLELHQPSPRIPHGRLAWRDVRFAAIVDMMTFARPGNRVLLDLDASRPVTAEARSSWQFDVHRPGQLPRRLALAVADMVAMAMTSSKRVLLALDRPSPRMPAHTLAWPRRFGLAAVANAIAVAVLVLLGSGASLGRRDVHTTFTSNSPHMVFIVSPQDAVPAGGGGGGDRPRGPIARAPAPAHEAVQRSDATAPPPPLEARAIVTSAPPVTGLPSVEPEAVDAALGTGGGSGVGTADGSGAGSGDGSGLGAGEGGGEGGGVYRLGAGVIAPVLLSQVRPNYSPRALAQRLQGSVLLELIIRHDGLPDRIRILQSLDPRELDEEAIRAVRQWRFRPGRVGSTPVDVLVTCIVDFHLR
jgi:TonB family protein